MHHIELEWTFVASPVWCYFHADDLAFKLSVQHYSITIIHEKLVCAAEHDELYCTMILRNIHET